jgi:hypothetical protein
MWEVTILPDPDGPGSLQCDLYKSHMPSEFRGNISVWPPIFVASDPRGKLTAASAKQLVNDGINLRYPPHRLLSVTKVNQLSSDRYSADITKGVGR